LWTNCQRTAGFAAAPWLDHIFVITLKSPADNPSLSNQVKRLLLLPHWNWRSRATVELTNVCRIAIRTVCDSLRAKAAVKNLNVRDVV